jgi:dipeptidyl aminopeptidase/acylaminoacyl peptidase
MTRWHDPAPGERDAGERTWHVVREAFDERLPSPRGRDWRPVAAIALGVAVLAAAFTPPGHAVLGSIRDAVRGEESAKPALFALPAPGRLLVNSAQGAWVVQPDGSKRLLAGYRDASWSPHGLYLAAVRGHELRALEPDGDIRWSIGRRNVALPRWSSFGRQDERIAYLAGASLRVVGGNGKGDRLLAPRVADVAPAWRPRTHVLAYATPSGRIVVVDADTRRVLRRMRAQQPPVELAWSSDGRSLMVRGRNSLTILGPGNRRLEPLGGPQSAPIVDATFSPDGQRVAFLQSTQGRGVLWLYPRLRPDGTAARRVFAGAGTMNAVEWSPDGRWFLLSWPGADQMLFIPSAAVRKLIAVSGIETAFGPAAQPAGWCCP